MNPRQRPLFAAVLLLAALLLAGRVLLINRPPPAVPLPNPPPAAPLPTPTAAPSPAFAPDPPPQRTSPDPAFPALTPPDPTELAPLPPHPDTLGFGGPDIPPEQEPAFLLTFFEAFREHYGAFPAGEDNRHFMNALRGRNPGRLGIFPLQHPRLNDEGELLDAWGTPFLFHKLSRDHLQIRSAGPDRLPYTPDDLLVPDRDSNPFNHPL